jgi:hypothetical protein
MEMITMKVSDFGMRVRFIEEDFLRNKIKAENKYITEVEIDLILAEQNELCDVSFVFYPFGKGFATQIFDNITNTKITVDDLNTFAFDFYISQATLISVSQEKARKELEKEQSIDERVAACIKKIKDKLYDMNYDNNTGKYQTLH